MRTPALLVSTLLLAACGEHGHEDPDVEGCEHLAMGPYQAITGAQTAGAGAPAIAEDHKAYTVTLPAGVAGNAGFVSFAASDLGFRVFYLDQPVTATFTTSAGAAIAPRESTTSSALCTAIKGRHVVPVEVGTIYVQLSSPTISMTNLVIEPEVAPHSH